MSRAILCALTLGVLPGLAAAQAERPTPATRVVRHFDFETKAINGILVRFPVDWFNGNPAIDEPAREGFPHWNVPGFDDEHAATGERSVRLPTKGGSTSLLLSRGSLPAMPGGDYLITAKVRTDQLKWARAQIRARFVRAVPPDLVEQIGERYTTVLGTEVRSELVHSPDKWTQVYMRLPGHLQAEYLQLELVLLQPSHQPGVRGMSHEVILEDLNGSASFDDIVVYQVPRLDLRTKSPGNIVEAPEVPELSVSVQDFTGEALDATLVVWDMDGNEVDRTRLDPSSFTSRARWVPNLDLFGWYRATLEVRNDAGLVGSDFTDFLWCDKVPHESGAEIHRFGLDATDLTLDELDILPDVMRRLRSGAAFVSVWSDHYDLTEGAALTRFEQAMDTLLDHRVLTTFALVTAPGKLAREASVDTIDPLLLLKNDETLWLPSLMPLLTKFGERVTRWQIGGGDSTAAFRLGDTLSEAERVQEILRRLVPRPTVVLPWDLSQPTDRVFGEGADIRASTRVALTITVPRQIPAASLPLYIKQWPEALRAGGLAGGVTQGMSGGATVLLEPVPSDLFGRRASAIELAKRCALAWSAGVQRLAIPAPWEYDGASSSDADTHALRPTTEAAVWRTMAAHLAGRTPAGEIPMPAGVQLLIAEGRGERSSIMIGWNDYADPTEAVVRQFLGPNAVRVLDPFGNSRMVEPTNGVHVIPLTEMPLIIEGVDVELARFRSGLSIEPEFVPSRAERHDLEIVMTNPWDVGISGRIRLVSPESFDFQPKVLSFALRRGETARLPISVALGVGEESGMREIMTSVELNASRAYPPIDIPIPIELGLDTVTLTASYRFAMGYDGEMSRVIITATITNTSDKPVSLEAFTVVPGFQGQEAPVSSLQPGDSTVKFFTFDNAVEKLRGKRVRVGLREQKGNGRLNTTLEIH